MKTQNERILKFLKSGKTITPLQALRMFGCFRLAGRIFELKKAGHKIMPEMILKNRKYFTKYFTKC